MEYQNYKAKDFVTDAFFQKWVIAPDAETKAFWEDWVKKYPFKRSDVDEAKEIIKVLGFTADFKTNNDFVEVWDTIQKNIQEEEGFLSAPEQPKYTNQWAKHFQKVAAVLVGLLIIGLGVLYFKPENSHNITYTTAYGQVNKIILPDSSQVILNANSVLSFASDWNSEDKARQVWLKGEAFFSVIKKRKAAAGFAKFKVYTNNLTVEVLGTEFNVNERRNNAAIVLQSGKVKVSLPKSSRQQNLFMQPGELVGYTGADRQVVKKTVNPQQYTSWVQNNLVFNKTTLGEIALLLEDNYGYQVSFKDEALANLRFTGSIPGNNLKLLFKSLTKLFDLQIVQEQNHLLITSNQPNNLNK